jgi:hypothetical protein
VAPASSSARLPDRCRGTVSIVTGGLGRGSGNGGQGNGGTTMGTAGATAPTSRRAGRRQAWAKPQGVSRERGGPPPWANGNGPPPWPTATATRATRFRRVGEKRGNGHGHAYGHGQERPRKPLARGSRPATGRPVAHVGRISQSTRSLVTVPSCAQPATS